jgi:DNA-directed RNA polymerase specialized sigma24 family protein
LTPRQILKIVNSILPSHFDTENVAHEIWLEAWLAAGTPPDGSPPVSHSAIYGRCVDAIRSKSREEDFNHYDRSRVLQSSEPLDVYCNLVTRLIGSASLSESDQKVVFLRFYLGQSIATIADTLSVTPRDVSRQLNQVLEQLRAAARRDQDEQHEPER